MKKVLIIIALVVILAGLAYLIWGGLEQNLVYFVTPTELAAKGQAAVDQPVRLGGLVVPGSVKAEEGTIRFSLTDEKGSSFEVVTHTSPPQMFQESMGVVVEGALKGSGQFLADRVMIKHGNEYRPPHEGQMPAQIYKQIQNQ